MNKSIALRSAVVALVVIALVVGFRLWSDDASSAVQVLTADEEQEAAELDRGELDAPVQSSGERVASAPAPRGDAPPSAPLIFVEQPIIRAPTERHVLVVERDSERAVPYARVLDGNTELAVTDLEGYASWSTGPVGLDGRIEVHAGGFGKVVTLVDASCTDRASALRIELVRGGTLRGHIRGLTGSGPFTASVVLDGNKLSTVGGFWPELRATSWSRPIDALGHFELTDLPPEVLFELRWNSPDGTSRRLQVEQLELQVGELRELEWDLEQHGRLDGTVVDAHGRGVAGIGVELQANNHASAFASGWFSTLARATSAADGRFQVIGLAPGEYLVGLDAQQAKEREEELLSATEKVVVPAGESAAVRLVVHTAVYVEGRVISVDGSSVYGAFVHVLGSSNKVVFGTSGARGAFRLGPLTPGPCRLGVGGAFAEGEGAPPASEVTAPATGVIIQLVPAEPELPTAKLSGRILDERTREPVSVPHTLQWSDAAGNATALSHSGSVIELSGLEPGTYTLFAVTHDGRVGRQAGVHLASGEHRAGVELLLQPGGEVHVSYPLMDDVYLRVTAGGLNLQDHADFQALTRRFRAPPGEVLVQLQRVIEVDGEHQLEVIGSRTVEVLAAGVVEVNFDE